MYEVYIGIETALNKNIPAKFCCPSDIYKILELFKEYDIKITRLYILGFPDETYHDVNQTLGLAIGTQASATLQTREVTQVHTLAIGPGTQLYDEYQDYLSYTGLISDQADHRVVRIQSCLDLCKRYPSIFSFYTSCLKKKDSLEIIELRAFYRLFVNAFPKSLFIVLHELDLSPIKFFRCFMKHAYSYVPKLSVNRVLLSIFPTILIRIYRDANHSENFVQYFLNCERLYRTSFVESDDYSAFSPVQVLNNKSLLELIPIIPRTTKLLSLSYDPDKLFSRFWLYKSTRVPYTGQTAYIVSYLPRSLSE